MTSPTRQPRRLPLLVGLLGTLGFIALGVPNALLSQIAYAVERGKLAATQEQLASVEAVSEAFRLVARLATPGVVQIRVQPSEEELAERRRALQERLGPDSAPEFLENLQERLRYQTGTGSGFVIDKSGHIVTNNHVISGHTDIRVVLDNGQDYQAKIVGADPKTDIAVLKIDPQHELHVLRWGNSDEMEVGDWVIAVGSPFGLTHSVTHGIISAKGRANIITSADVSYQNFLQTDAAINPGNSGGPLLNLRAEVIGINTAIASGEMGTNAGVAFTIPANMARRIAEQILTTGVVERGWLGVQLAEIDDEIQSVFELPDRNGAMVAGLFKGEAGESGGLMSEDFIVRINGAPVRDIQAVRNLIASQLPGETARLGIIRDGEQPRELLISLGRQPADVRQSIRGEAITSRFIAELGLAGRTILPSVAQRLVRMNRAPETMQPGVLVERVSDEAVGAGVKPNEIIFEADGRTVGSVGDLAQAARNAGSTRRLQVRVVGENGEVRTETLAVRG